MGIRVKSQVAKNICPLPPHAYETKKNNVRPAGGPQQMRRRFSAFVMLFPNVAGHECASARSVTPLVSLYLIVILQHQSFGPPSSIGFPPIPQTVCSLSCCEQKEHSKSHTCQEAHCLGVVRFRFDFLKELDELNEDGKKTQEENRPQPPEPLHGDDLLSDSLDVFFIGQMTQSFHFSLWRDLGGRPIAKLGHHAPFTLSTHVWP